MMRQITLIAFKDDFDTAELAEMETGFASLSAIVPGIRRFQYGPDMNLEETGFDYALVIDFDGPDDWRAYREHPQHVAFAQTYLPRIARVERCQYRLEKD